MQDTSTNWNAVVVTLYGCSDVQGSYHIYTNCTRLINKIIIPVTLKQVNLRT